MQRVLALVEGQTEERFLKNVVCPHLWEREISLIPIIAATRRVKSGGDFKGGITSYQKVDNDLRRLLGDSNAAAVTTFIDYYGLPTDFPGMDSRPPGPPLVRAEHIETQWASRVDNHRFRPYLMVHEFEALLFCVPEEVGTTLHSPTLVTELTRVRSNFGTPEEINEHPEHAPSRRITSLSPGYQKAVHGPIIAGRIGLGAMREQCSHFSEWLNWLESL